MRDPLFVTVLLSTLRLSTPIIITALGNMYCMQAGVMNLGADGMMLSGAFGAVVVSYFTGSAWLGVFAGILCGGVIGTIHSFVSVEFGGTQNISGLGLNILAAGFTGFFCRNLFNSSMTPRVANVQNMTVLAGVPYIGGFLMRLSPIFYLMIVVFLISWYIMAQTVHGLRIVSVGSDPQTAETAGINVWRLKHICVITCGLMAGLAGAYLSIGQLNMFVEDMTAGKGMLAIIAVTIGRRKPLPTVIAALMFGIFDSLQLQLQINNRLDLPPELIQAIPYLVAILALFFGSSKIMDTVNMRPYVKNKYKF